MFVDASNRLTGFVEHVNQCAQGALIRIDPAAGTAKFQRCTDYSAVGATRLPTTAGSDGGAIRCADLLNRTYTSDGTCTEPSGPVPASAPRSSPRNHA